MIMKKLFYAALILFGTVLASCSGNVEDKAKQYAEQYVKAQFDKDKNAAKEQEDEFEKWTKDLDFEDRAKAKDAFEEQYGLYAVQQFADVAAEMVQAVKDGKGSTFTTKANKIVSGTEKWVFPECMKGAFDKGEDALKKMSDKAVVKGIAAYVSEQLFADVETPMKSLCSAAASGDKGGIKDAMKEVNKIKKGLGEETKYNKALDPAIEKCLTANLAAKFGELAAPISKAYADLDKTAMKTACKEYDKFVGLFPEDMQQTVNNAFSDALFEGITESVKAVGEMTLKAGNDESKLKEIAKKTMAVTEATSDAVRQAIMKAEEEYKRQAEEALQEVQKATEDLQK